MHHVRIPETLAGSGLGSMITRMI